MIYINAVRKIIDPMDRKTTRPVFQIEFVKMSSGEIVKGDVVCTSSSWERNTLNIRFVESGEVRTIHPFLIIKFNQMEVMI